MAVRKIKHASFSYRVAGKDPIRPGETIFIEKKAGQGEEVDIPFDDDIERGERFGAFLREGEHVPGTVPTVPRHTAGTESDSTDEDNAPVSQLLDEELVAWIKEDGPTVQEVVDAADGDPDQARRLLNAEEAATGGDPRKGVIAGLQAVIGNR